VSTGQGLAATREPTGRSTRGSEGKQLEKEEIVEVLNFLAQLLNFSQIKRNAIQRPEIQLPNSQQESTPKKLR
jgi:hypothetical protein